MGRAITKPSSESLMTCALSATDTMIVEFATPERWVPLLPLYAHPMQVSNSSLHRIALLEKLVTPGLGLLPSFPSRYCAHIIAPLSTCLRSGGSSS